MKMSTQYRFIDYSIYVLLCTVPSLLYVLSIIYQTIFFETISFHRKSKVILKTGALLLDITFSQKTLLFNLILHEKTPLFNSILHKRHFHFIQYCTKRHFYFIQYPTKRHFHSIYLSSFFPNLPAASERLNRMTAAYTAMLPAVTNTIRKKVRQK